VRGFHALCTVRAGRRKKKKKKKDLFGGHWSATTSKTQNIADGAKAIGEQYLKSTKEVVFEAGDEENPVVERGR